MLQSTKLPAAPRRNSTSTFGRFLFLTCSIVNVVAVLSEPTGHLRRRMQQACMVIDTNKYYRISAKHSGLYLSVDGLSTAEEGNVIQDEVGQSTNWRFYSIGTGNYFNLVAEHSGMGLAGTFQKAL